MRYFLLFAALLAPFFLAAQLRSPSEFLPHRLGETFTPHHLLVDYFKHVAAESPLVELEEYGRTNEDRPLLLAFVSSPQNLARLEDIRRNNLRAAGLLEGDTDPVLNEIAIVWLSYSVHGNEAAGSEASMRVVHTLADPAQGQVQGWLENTVVIIDPSLNPDGYNRYTNWYRQVSGRFNDPNPSAREHNEPWPGGRVNHYLFDLNRDWAWQTQVESRQRMVRYKEWMPHIHADIHEQGYTSPYYFAPAAAPFHEYITDWQEDFQTEIGRNHAEYFDREGWLYFTRERFDLLYPSYGDTYPTFNGGIGMTYEQGGHSRAGRGIELPNGDTLTLGDRIEHHTTTSLSTIEIASRESDRVTEQFRDYFAAAVREPQGDYLTYIVPATTPAGKRRRLRRLLDRNGIEYGVAGRARKANLYHYRTGETKQADIREGDLIISAYQPKSVLTQVLFDPEVLVEDSITYDITGWSVPMAYGLDAYASTTRLDLDVQTASDMARKPVAANELSGAYAVVIPWEDVTSVAVLGALLRKGVQVRTAGNDFTFGRESYPAGSIVVTRADNRKRAGYLDAVAAAINEHEASFKLLQTGFSTVGGDLGNGSYQLAGNAKVAIIGGEGVSPNEFGQVWWYFDQELAYPVSIFYPEDMASLLRQDYDVIVLPEGRYDLKDHAEELMRWVRSGGRLIAIGRANAGLAGQEGFGLEEKPATNDDSGDEGDDGGENSRLLPYGDQERRFISGFNPGAVLGVEMDDSHPLSFGIGDHYFSLKTGSTAYDYLEDGVNVGRVRTNPLITGFVGAEAREKLDETLVFGVEGMGRGEIVYLIDNPLYRGFWEEGKLLFGNAVFQEF